MREKSVENYLKKRVKEKGGLCIKIIPDILNGLPDRMVILPGKSPFFIELKAPGQKPRKLQNYWLNRLAEMGQKAYVASNFVQVDEIMNNEG